MEALTLPDGFTLVRKGRSLLAVREDYRELLLSQGIHEPRRVAEACPHTEYLEGRTSLAVVPIEGTDGERMVIRHYQRGGLLGWLIRDKYLHGSRSWRELLLCEEARRRGIDTIEVLAAEHHRFLGPIHTGDLLSKEIEGSIDLLSYLSGAAEPPRWALAEKRRVIVAAAKAVRRMHEAGLFHRDLHLKNILIRQDREGDVEVRIIDLDRSRFYHKVSPRHCRSNLSRLNRSVVKFGAGSAVTRTDRMRFYRNYVDGDQPSRQERRRLFAACRRNLWLHSLLWRKAVRPTKVEPSSEGVALEEL